jgi:hypothetical protein
MKNNIPSDEDFARAKKFMSERYQNLDAVENAVKLRVGSHCPLHGLYLLAQEDVDFRIYVFFDADGDIERCKENGTTTTIETAAYEELERFGRGKREEIKVAFEYDSHENVIKNYDGDYMFRLR